MKKILIYGDEGANLFGVKALLAEFQRVGLTQTYQICCVDRCLFQTNQWQKETDLLIFPGGRDIPYHQALQGTANRSIADFVHHGGRFLGICAGGYYGSALIEFEQGHPLEVVGARELKFFPGVARGPAYGLGTFCYHSQRGAQIAQLNLCPSFSSSSKAAAYYNGGCAFVAAEEYPGISILARYADIAHQPAAIIQCQVGTGVAFLCGVHPEYSAEHWGSKHQLTSQLLSLLKKSEQERQWLFNHLLKFILED